MTTALALRPNTDLDRYFQEINRYPLLSRGEEHALALQFYEAGDITAAHKLVVSNLRFVVKTAWEYRHYGLPMIDLVQEGNIGLMHAVKKFNPHKGYRLITYAVWWIRAHIQSFVMKSWSMVKVGSGKVAKRLFFKLRSTKSKIEQDAAGNNDIDVTEDLAERLGVSEADVSDMELRLAARDFSLDAPLTDETNATFVDSMTATTTDPEEETARGEEQRMVRYAVDQVKDDLNDKERFILDNRLLTDDPKTLEEVGSHFDFTRERARQIEKKLLGKIRKHFPGVS